MTKDEVVTELQRIVTSARYPLHILNGLARCRDAVSALDVCTKAHRRFTEAAVDYFKRCGYPGLERELHLSLAMYEAEREPPDPLEAFVAEVRSAADRAYDTREDVLNALAKLDAARGSDDLG